MEPWGHDEDLRAHAASAIERRRDQPPRPSSEALPRDTPIDRFNTDLALKITSVVGTMWCAYVFALIAPVSLPNALRAGTPEEAQDREIERILEEISRLRSLPGAPE